MTHSRNWRPLDWYLGILDNLRVSLSGAEMKVRHAEADRDRLLSGVVHLECQIAEAKRQGKEGFDSERFMVPRKGGAK